MSLRKVCQIDSSGNLLANRESFSDGTGCKIYRDVEWDAYVVKIYANGKHYKAADYHADDLVDAKGTAMQAMLDSQALKAELEKLDELLRYM